MTDPSPYVLPEGLPVPMDDGAADHLTGAALPNLALEATDGSMVNLRTLGESVLFFFPRTGVPGEPPNTGFNGEEWETIPGARGCTPQSCGFRDAYGEFRGMGVEVFGVSTSTSTHQREFVARTGCGYRMLSDARLALATAMRLPTFDFPVESGGPNQLFKRMAWYVTPDVAGTNVIRKVWYPVFPPDHNAEVVLAWLRAR